MVLDVLLQKWPSRPLLEFGSYFRFATPSSSMHRELNFPQVRQIAFPPGPGTLLTCAPANHKYHKLLYIHTAPSSKWKVGMCTPPVFNAVRYLQTHHILAASQCIRAVPQVWRAATSSLNEGISDVLPNIGVTNDHTNMLVEEYRNASTLPGPNCVVF